MSMSRRPHREKNVQATGEHAHLHCSRRKKSNAEVSDCRRRKRRASVRLLKREGSAWPGRATAWGGGGILADEKVGGGKKGREGGG